MFQASSCVGMMSGYDVAVSILVCFMEAAANGVVPVAGQYVAMVGLPHSTYSPQLLSSFHSLRLSSIAYHITLLVFKQSQQTPPYFNYHNR